MRLRSLAAAAVAGLLLGAAPAPAQTISRLGLGLVIGGLGGAVDTIGAPASAAYSFRLLKQGYAGKAVRLRRASDNLELDIGFTAGGDFDTAAAATHCAATSCFLAKWYDQSGNARDMLQATAGNQPPLAFNCIGGLPCLQLTTVAVGLLSGNVTPATGVASLNMTANRTIGTGACFMLFQNGAGANRLTYRGVPGLALWGGASGNLANTSPDNSWRSVTGVLNGASSNLNDNGGTGTATATGNTVAGPIGNLGAATTTCLQTEAVVWDNYVLTTAEIAALTANQRAYFGF